MKRSEYTALIAQRLGTYCDLLPEGMYDGKKYDMAAIFCRRESQTVLFKENIMDYLDSKEILLLTYDDNKNHIEKELNSLGSLAVKNAAASRHHKSTILTRVFIFTGNPQAEIIHKIVSFRFSRIFRFFFWGWTEVRTVAVDLQNGRIYTNRAARTQRKFFAPEFSDCRTRKTLINA